MEFWYFGKANTIDKPVSNLMHGIKVREITDRQNNITMETEEIKS